MGIRKILIAGTALCALTLFVAQPASAAQSVGSVTHAASGCAGMTIKVPKAGTTPTAASMGMPAGTESFYAQAAAHHAKWLTDLSCGPRTGRIHTLKPAPTGASAKAGIRNTLVSGNWSGYQINKTAQYVQGGWTVPTLVTPRPGYSTSGYYSSTWTGIGGGFNAGNPLIQAGTAQHMDNGQTSYYAWYEVVGGTGDTGGEIPIMRVHPGDVVGSVSLWTAATGAQMGFCDFSITGTNQCVQFPVKTEAPGTSEEWIEEAPSQYGRILPLADFQQVTFVNSCWAPVYQSGAACLPIAGNGPQAINLEQYVLGGYQVLASPDPLNSTGDGFTIYYNQPEQICKPPCP